MYFNKSNKPSDLIPLNSSVVQLLKSLFQTEIASNQQRLESAVPVPGSKAPKKAPKHKPVLVFGPAHSLKATHCKEALKQLGFNVKIGQPHDLTRDSPILSKWSLLGKNGYIVKCLSTPQLMQSEPTTMIVYCYSGSPYEHTTSQQLNEKFTVLDLGKYLQTVNNAFTKYAFVPTLSTKDQGIETDQRGELRVGSIEPWNEMKQFCNPVSTFATRHHQLQLSPTLAQSLFRNLELVGGSTLQAALQNRSWLADKLSGIDPFPYIDHSSMYQDTMECCWMSGALRLNGNEKLNWKGDGRSVFTGSTKKKRTYNPEDDIPFVLKLKKDPGCKPLLYISASEKREGITQAALVKETVSTLKTVMKAAKQPPKPVAVNPETESNSMKRARSTPMCKKCSVPMKGHHCPFKQTKGVEPRAKQTTLKFGK